jgi:methionine-rich copper-binding protein CopC
LPAAPSPWLLAGLLLVAAVAAGVLVSGRAGAHAGYDRSEPAFAAELDSAPLRIGLWFSQELFRREGANTIRLVDAEGAELPLGEATVDSDDRSHLFAELEGELPPGRYLVKWTSLSAEDGDDDAGVYPFYVTRSPDASDKTADRALADELLIQFPGNQLEARLTEAESDLDPADPGPTTLPIAEEDAGGGEVSAGPITLAVMSVVAVLGLIGGRLLRSSRRKRS